MRLNQKLTALALSTALVFSSLPVFAQEDETAEPVRAETNIETEYKQKYKAYLEDNQIDIETPNQQVIVKLKEDVPVSLFEVQTFAISDVPQFETVSTLAEENIAVLKTNTVDALLETLNAEESVEYAQPDYKLYTSSVEIDSKQWALDNSGQIIGGNQGTDGADLNIQAVWNLTQGSQDIVIGVMDTGIDINHKSIRNNIWTNPNEAENGTDSDNNGYKDDIHGWDFVNNDNTVYDMDALDEHGTHVAGIIAGDGTNGFYGIAPNVKIMPLKVMDYQSGYTSDIIEAISYAKKMGVKVINCSFDGLDFNPALEEAIRNSGILFVCASGNYGRSTNDLVTFPACFELDNVIAVSGVDNKGTIAAISTYGEPIDVSAPAMGIYSTLPDNQYGFKDGTSAAAAFVSGTVALLLSIHPDLSPAQIKRAVTAGSATTFNSFMRETGNLLDVESVLEYDFVRDAVKSRNNPILIEVPEDGVSTQFYPFHFDIQDSKPILTIEQEFSFVSGEIQIFSQVVTDEELEVLFSSSLDSNARSVTIEGLQADTAYEFYLQLKDNTTTYSYLGNIKYSNTDSVRIYGIHSNIYQNLPDSGIMVMDTNDLPQPLSANYEVEPNDTRSMANTLEDGVTKYGNISRQADEDWFRITFNAPGTANFWLDNIPSGCNYSLRVYDESGSMVGYSYNPNNTPELINQLDIPIGGSEYYVQVSSSSGFSENSSYLLRAKWYPKKDEYEPNDDHYDAVTIPTDGTEFEPTINYPEDIDCFKFSLSGSATVDINLTYLPSGVNYDIELYSLNGTDETYLTGSYNTGTADDTISIQLGSGTYYIKIYARDFASYSKDYYVISVSANTVETLPMDRTITGSTATEKYYDFNLSIGKGVSILLSDFGSADLDLFLYKKSGSSYTQIAKATTNSSSEKIGKSLSYGDYRLKVLNFDKTNASYKITTKTTTTAQDAVVTTPNWFPPVLQPGEIAAVTVTATNGGTNIWTNAAGYKLGTTLDAPAFCNTEHLLAVSDSIEYDNENVFRFNITAPRPTVQQSYTLGFRMKQNTSFFGNTSTNTVSVAADFETLPLGSKKIVSGDTEKWYKINITQSGSYAFRTLATTTKCDTELALYSSAMELLDINDDAYDTSTFSRYSKIEKYLGIGTYYIKVNKYNGGPTHCSVIAERYTENAVMNSASFSNVYEGFYKYTVSESGNYVFLTKKYLKDCDTYLLLLDSTGTILAQDNDSAGFYAKIEQNLSAGTYYIRVTNAPYLLQGQDIKTQCTLTVTKKSAAPPEQDRATISISAPGEGEFIYLYNENTFRIAGTVENCSAVTVKVNGKTVSNIKKTGNSFEGYYAPQRSGEYTIIATGTANLGSNPSVSRTVTVAVNDDGNSFETATALNVGTERIAAVDYTGDVDFFSFTPQESASYMIYSSGALDTKGVLYAPDKTTVLCYSNDAPDSINFCVARTLEQGKTYYVRAESQLANTTGRYTINIEKINEPNDERFRGNANNDLGQWGLLNWGQSYSLRDINYQAKAGIDINVLPVWEYTKGENVEVAVVDTGIQGSHPDLTVLPGYNYVHNNTITYNENELINPPGWYNVYEDSPEKKDRDEYWRRHGCLDVNGHGTHVAGIVSAKQNTTGISGVAPEVQIVPLKVLGMPTQNGSYYSGYITNLIDAIDYIDSNNISIANMSVYWADIDTAAQVELRENLENASDTLFVVAAGNREHDLSDTSDPELNQYPALSNTSNMIVVANITSDGSLADNSNFGGPTHLGAPGTDIYSTYPNTYAYMSGTSMAAPHVTGVAALLKSYYHGLSVQELKNRILTNVTPLESLQGKTSTGGMLNAWNAFSNGSESRIVLSETDDLHEYNGVLEENIKQIITDTKNNLPEERFTNRIFVNFVEGTNKDELIQTIAPAAVKVKDIRLSGSVMLEFPSVEEAKNAVDLFNANDNVRYSEPVYVLMTSI